tara:strand:+ start:687 stop:935 length:249 start_codon:yes stop_codon:yes gene_type:complete
VEKKKRILMDLSSLREKNINKLNTRGLIEFFLVERKEPLQFKNNEVRTTLSTRNILPIMGIFSGLIFLGAHILITSIKQQPL